MLIITNDNKKDNKDALYIKKSVSNYTTVTVSSSNNYNYNYTYNCIIILSDVILDIELVKYINSTTQHVILYNPHENSNWSSLYNTGDNSDISLNNLKVNISIIENKKDLYRSIIKTLYTNVSIINKEFDKYELYQYSVNVRQLHKSNLHNYVDKIYCINLENRYNKFEKMIDKFNKYNLEVEILEYTTS